VRTGASRLDWCWKETRVFLIFPSTLKMEATRSSEKAVNTTSTRCHNAEDCFLHSHRRESLKSWKDLFKAYRKIIWGSFY
jgi:hypothetical protein